MFVGLYVTCREASKKAKKKKAEFELSRPQRGTRARIEKEKQGMEWVS